GGTAPDQRVVSGPAAPSDRAARSLLPGRIRRSPGPRAIRAHTRWRRGVRLDHDPGDCVFFLGTRPGAAGVPARDPEERLVASPVLAPDGRSPGGDGRAGRADHGGALMLTVKERGHFVATVRWVHVWLMETLAAWVPTAPEME